MHPRAILSPAGMFSHAALAASGSSCERKQTCPLLRQHLLVRVWSSGALAQRNQSRILLRGIDHLFPQLLHTRKKPGLPEEIVRIPHGIVLCPLRQIRLRPGVRHRAPVQSENPVPQLRVPDAGAEIIRAPGKFRILLRVLLLQYLREGIGQHELCLHLVHLPEPRVEIDIGKIVVQQKGTEAVDRRDLRRVEQRLLPLQMPVFRILLQPVADGLRNALPHLGCRRARECHNEQPVNIHRILLVRDQPDDALDEHRRLAASGRCGDQNVMPPRVDHLLLLCRKLYCHLPTPLRQNLLHQTRFLQGPSALPRSPRRRVSFLTLCSSPECGDHSRTPLGTGSTCRHCQSRRGTAAP